MKNGLVLMIFVGLGVGLSQIIGVILGIQLYLKLKEEIDINELRRILHHTWFGIPSEFLFYKIYSHHWVLNTRFKHII